MFRHEIEQLQMMNVHKARSRFVILSEAKNLGFLPPTAYCEGTEMFRVAANDSVCKSLKINAC
jgi:hypothetical protein